VGMPRLDDRFVWLLFGHVLTSGSAQKDGARRPDVTRSRSGLLSRPVL